MSYELSNAMHNAFSVVDDYLDEEYTIQFTDYPDHEEKSTS